MYLASNSVIEWLSVVKMLKTEIHLFRNSAIPLFRIPRFVVSLVQGYNPKVHDVCTCEKHRATVIISRASQVYLRDVISRSRNRLSTPLKVRFAPC